MRAQWGFFDNDQKAKLFFSCEFCIRKFLVEFIDSPRCVNKLHLSGIERMRAARNFKLDQRIFIAIFPLDRIIRWSAWLWHKGIVAGEVLEDDCSVVLWMYFLFHYLHTFWKSDGKDKVFFTIMLKGCVLFYTLVSSHPGNSRSWRWSIWKFPPGWRWIVIRSKRNLWSNPLSSRYAVPK